MIKLKQSLSLYSGVAWGQNLVWRNLEIKNKTRMLVENFARNFKKFGKN